MAATINRQARIGGTRITVYDVWTYAQAGWHPSSIAATLGLSTDEVQTALAYIAENRQEVLATYDSIVSRIERGNSAEVESRRQQSHRRLQARLQQIQLQ